MKMFRLIQILSLIVGILANISIAQNEPKPVFHLKCLQHPNDCILYEALPKIDIETDPQSALKVIIT